MSTTIIAEYWKSDNETFQNQGLHTIKLNEDKYQPFLEFILDNNLVFKIPINKDSEFKYTTEDNYDLLINNYYGLRFDKNSSSSFEIFKDKLNSIITKNLCCEYYPSSTKINYYGTKNSNGEWNGFLTEYYNNRKNSIKFKGEMEDNEFVSGIFKNKEETIIININNIVDNIPNGYINVKINNQEYNILYDSIKNYEIYDIKSIDFVNTICTQHFGLEFMQKLNFVNTSSSNRDYILLKEIKQLQEEINKINISLNNKYVGIIGLLKWIIGF